MNYQGRVLDHIRALAQLFSVHCDDRRTLDEISALLDNRNKWEGAHDLFQRIRGKSLKSQSAGDFVAITQYRFEEACAKTLYNLGNFSAPFDADSPYWIVPTALALAEKLGIAAAEVTGRVAI